MRARLRSILTLSQMRMESSHQVTSRYYTLRTFFLKVMLVSFCSKAMDSFAATGALLEDVATLLVVMGSFMGVRGTLLESVGDLLVPVGITLLAAVGTVGLCLLEVGDADLGPI